MRQQALGEDCFQARLDIGPGMGITDHRVQAVAQLRAGRQDLVQPVGERGTVGGTAEVTGHQHPGPLRQAAFVGTEQQVGAPVGGQLAAAGGVVERRVAEQHGRDFRHANAERAHRRNGGAVAGVAVDKLRLDRNDIDRRRAVGPLAAAVDQVVVKGFAHGRILRPVVG
ncbi:hypothetical protein G6F57_020719 [Rhizopus arrhizus]|nr:hypothetical protein G6F57_020719 [Rhizopus arrhizus]